MCKGNAVRAETLEETLEECNTQHTWLGWARVMRYVQSCWRSTAYLVGLGKGNAVRAEVLPAAYFLCSPPSAEVGPDLLLQLRVRQLRVTPYLQGVAEVRRHAEVRRQELSGRKLGMLPR